MESTIKEKLSCGGSHKRQLCTLGEFGPGCALQDGGGKGAYDEKSDNKSMSGRIG